VSESYLPEPAGKRAGVALCLSGGGYRASLFHLGTLRRLNELGILAQVDTVSAVSGGSILAAFVAQHVGEWPTSGTLPDFDRRIAEPFR
jgi:NTE family protein